MIVGVLQVELLVYEAVTLKDKRRVVKSIKDRIAHAFNVSIAEVDALDQHRRAILGVALVGNDTRYVQSRLDKVVDRFRHCRGASLVDYQIDLI